MPQYSRPISDVSNSIWTPSVVYAQLNAVTPGGGGVVISTRPNEPDVFVVRMGDVVWPLKGPQKLRVMLAVQGGDGGPGAYSGCGPQRMGVGIALFQGDTLITEYVGYPGPTPEEVTLELPEFPNLLPWYDDDLIARNLRVRARTIPPVKHPCCPDCPLPGILYATIVDARTQSGGVDGTTLALGWTTDYSAAGQWVGEYRACGKIAKLVIFCGAGFWQSGGGGAVSRPLFGTSNVRCHPFLAVYPSHPMISECAAWNGTSGFVISETPP
jgi:hypothetical protein